MKLKGDDHSKLILESVAIGLATLATYQKRNELAANSPKSVSLIILGLLGWGASLVWRIAGELSSEEEE